MAAIAENNPGRPISDKQDRYLRDLAAKYRRQIPLKTLINPSDDDITMKVLGWLAPELVKNGLLKNEEWVPAHCSEAVRMFSDESLHLAATLIAAVHPYALDYLKQIPILALAVTGGASRRSGSVQLQRAAVRLKTAHKLRALFETGPKTRDVMKAFKIAPPLRVISGGALNVSHFVLVDQLGRLSPSTLAQCINKDAGLQQVWLDYLLQWSSHMDARFDDGGILFDWAAIAISREQLNHRRINVYQVADYAARNRAAFNESWTWGGATQRANQWHTDLARMSKQEAFLNQYGIGWEDRIDYGDLPDVQHVGPFTFAALRSGLALFEEGKAMHNCVYDYVPDVVGGRSRLYTIRRGDECIGTVELNPSGPPKRGYSFEAFQPKELKPIQKWRIGQAEAPCGERLGPRADAAVKSFLSVLNGDSFSWQTEPKPDDPNETIKITMGDLHVIGVDMGVECRG